MELNILINNLKSTFGTEFQRQFTIAMKKVYGNYYQSTQTYGNKGDIGVDGILYTNKKAFFIYAPEEFKEQRVLEKMKSDCEKFKYYVLNGNWKDITGCVFVIKTNRFGITSDIQQLAFLYNCELMVLDDIIELLKYYVVPSEVKSSLLGNIKYLKESYERLRKEYNEYNGDFNKILSYEGLCEEDRRFSQFLSIHNTNCKIFLFRKEYYMQLDKMGIGLCIDELLKVATPLNMDKTIAIIEGFSDIGDTEKQQKRIYLCDSLINILQESSF